MKLIRYQKMRKFTRTPEPAGVEAKGRGPLRFVVQMHAASRMHYDFRLEMDGVLKSWAVPKGPSLDPLERRLAVRTEDHPIDYGGFEGVIPKGNYGAGTVMVWDHGTYVARETEDRNEGEALLLNNLAKGQITFVLQGQKLKGEFALIKLAKGEEDAWLLVKKHDQFVSRQEVTYEDRSALTGRTLGEIARESEDKKIFWTAKGRYETPQPEAEKAAKARPRKLLKTPAPLGTKKLQALLKKGTLEEVMPVRFKARKTIMSKGVFDRDGWIFEPAWDGYRAIAVADGKASKLYGRTGAPFQGKFGAIVNALKTFKTPLMLDGFVVAVDQNAAPRRKGSLGSDEGGIYVFYAIDILHLNGRNLRELPLEERKVILSSVIKDRNECLRLNAWGEKEGKAVFVELQDQQCKGVLARDAKGPYEAKTGDEWFIFPSHLGADGVSDASGGHIPPLSNLAKIYWPAEGYTKGDLITYYREIAPLMLPYLIDRPQSLNRHPNGIEGEGFFQKEMAGQVPRWAKTVTVAHSNERGSITYALCQDEGSLLYLANLGCIEINPWNSRVDTLENPDYVVIDLDPNEAPFKAVIEVGLLVRKTLELIGAPAYCKTSGGRGLHIYVPLAPRYSYDEVRVFAEVLANYVHKKLPAITSVERMPSRRRGRVYLDFLQNRRGQTTAAVYAARPRPKAPVSTPISWDELNDNLNPTAFTIKTVIPRVLKLGDLWQGFFRESADLPDCKNRLEKLMAMLSK